MPFADAALRVLFVLQNQFTYIEQAYRDKKRRNSVAIVLYINMNRQSNGSPTHLAVTIRGTSAQNNLSADCIATGPPSKTETLSRPLAALTCSRHHLWLLASLLATVVNRIISTGAVTKVLRVDIPWHRHVRRVSITFDRQGHRSVGSHAKCHWKLSLDRTRRSRSSPPSPSSIHLLHRKQLARWSSTHSLVHLKNPYSHPKKP
jgi:hypothetical protein